MAEPTAAALRAVEEHTMADYETELPDDRAGDARPGVGRRAIGVAFAVMVAVATVLAGALPAGAAPATAPAAAVAPAPTAAKPKVTIRGIAAPIAHIRSGPSTKHKIVGKLKFGKKVTARLHAKSGWYKIGKKRFVSSKVVQVVIKSQAKAPKPATPKPVSRPSNALPVSVNPGGFDPDNIISDENFYRVGAMTKKQVKQFVDRKNAYCTGASCLSRIKITTVDIPADGICAAYVGGKKQAAGGIIYDVSQACGINPQVLLVMLQRESGLLTRGRGDATLNDWAWGWNCPDPGSSDTSLCDPTYAGFFAQAYGAAHQLAANRANPGSFSYQVGVTSQIAFSPVGPQCGSAPVTPVNIATASLYNYLPYQPNEAALAAGTGFGDECSSYGNRNFFFIYSQYFGRTGGGVAAGAVTANGLSVTVPASPFVPASIAGKEIIAPTPEIARGIADGLSTLGLPYVWGGGTAGGPPDQGCARGVRDKNACQGVVGFDCSGLTAYVLRQAGFIIPTNSTGQRSNGKKVKKAKAQAGDIVGYPGHVTVYLGEVDGQKYMLEAPDVGKFVRISYFYTQASASSGVDKKLHRYWK